MGLVFSKQVLYETSCFIVFLEHSSIFKSKQLMWQLSSKFSASCFLHTFCPPVLSTEICYLVSKNDYGVNHFPPLHCTTNKPYFSTQSNLHTRLCTRHLKMLYFRIQCLLTKHLLQSLIWRFK